MGATLSRIDLWFDEACRLGNPEKPLFIDKDPFSPYGYHGISVVRNSCYVSAYGNLAYEGETTFAYQVNPRKFDTGNLIVVRYKLNMDHEDLGSLENRILFTKDSMPPRIFNEHILPDILPINSYATYLDISTHQGKPQLAITKTTQSIYDRPYNIIPPTLNNLPRISISLLLKKQGFSSRIPHIAVVDYQGETYAFKYHGRFPVDTFITNDDRVLQEVEHRSRFHSPFILNPSHIVTDDDPRGRFRGFLEPFSPAGSLDDVLLRLTEDKTNEYGQKLASTTPPLRISWPVKHRWCMEMVGGLLALHQSKAYIGSFTLENFLLDDTGHVKLVDILPIRGFNALYTAPEVVRTMSLEFTSERDIFNLGIVMWVLAEEQLKFDRESPADKTPDMTWSEESNSAPLWFRKLVAMCVQVDPEERPSLGVVAAMLTANLANF